MDDDLQALHRLLAGDEAALVELMERYRAPVFRLAWRYTGNGADAQEITEEVFVRIFFNARKYKPRASVRSWIFTIAANLSRDVLRRRRKHRRVSSIWEPRRNGESDEPMPELSDPQRDPGAEVAADETMVAMQQAISDLPEKLRFPFVYCALEGASHEEAGEILRISPKAVEMRIYRARKELQQRLRKIRGGH